MQCNGCNDDDACTCALMLLLMMLMTHVDVDASNVSIMNLINVDNTNFKRAIVDGCLGGKIVERAIDVVVVDDQKLLKVNDE